MGEARKAPAQIFIRRAHTDMTFIISHLTDNIPLLDLAAVFTDGSPVQKAHFPAGIIKKIGLPHINDLFG